MIRSPIRGGGSGSGFALVPGATGVRLVAPGSVSAALTFTRAQVAMFSTALAPDGETVQSYAANLPRFNGAAQRLLMEGQRTNELTQPNNFATWSTLTGGTGSAPTLTPNFGTAPDGSSTATRLQVNKGGGTTSADFSGLSIPTSAGSAKGIWIRTVSGTARVQVATTSLLLANQTDVTTTWQRVRRVLPVEVAHRVLLVGGTAASSDSADLLIWGASSEPGAPFVSSFFGPSTTGSVLRGGDSATCALSGLFPAGAGTIIIKAMLPQSAPAGADQLLAQNHDGTDNNRIRLRNVAGGNTIVLGTVVGGSATDATSLGGMTPGTPFKAIFSFGGGRVAGLLDGGTVQAITGLPSGLTTFDLANNVARSAPANGEFEIVDALPYIVPDVAMQGVLTATP